MKIGPIIFIIICITMTFFFVKKTTGKGCISYGYFFLVISSINLFTFFSWVFMYSSTQDLYHSIFSGQNYYSTVVNIIEEERYDDETHEYYTMQTPIVQFTSESGRLVEKQLDFSTSGIEIGDSYKINYDEPNDKLITLGFTLILKLVSALIFTSIFSLLFSGLVNFILGYQMDTYYAIASKIGWYLLLPFLMICFDALLIYALFHGNSIPFFATLLVCFFVFVLSLGILGYFKMLFSQGEPKITRTGAGSWSADWQNE